MGEKASDTAIAIREGVDPGQPVMGRGGGNERFRKLGYYRLLQAVRTENAWEEWVLYMLTAVEQTAAEAFLIVQAIKDALLDYKRRIRKDYKF